MEDKFEILIRFKYIKKEYYIVSKKNKIYFACNDGNEIKFELSNEEKQMSLKVYSAFLVNKENAIKVDQIEINDREYYIFYDKESGNYYWERVNYVDYDNAEDNVCLNTRYNHKSPIMYMSDYNKMNLKDKIYTNLIIFGTAILVAVGVAYINPVTLASNYEIADSYNDVEISTQETENVNKYDWNRIQKIIEENTNLQDDEKEFLYNLKFVFDEHYDKIDLKLIEKRLEILEFDYVDIPNKEGKIYIAGTFNSETCRITLYGYSGTDYSEENKHCFKNTNKDIAMHEIGHALAKYSKHLTKIYELSDEYWKRSLMEILEDKGLIERNKDDDITRPGRWGYEYAMPVYYILTKFMTIDEIIEFHYTGNRNIIAKELAKYGTEEEAYQLLTRIDSVFFDKDILNDSTKFRSMSAEIYELLNEYYKKMTGINLYDNLEMEAILYSHDIRINGKNPFLENESRGQAFHQVMREALRKDGNVTENEIKYAKITSTSSLIKYNNNLFFGKYRENMQVILILESDEGEKYVTVEITEQMKEEFEEIYQKINEEKIAKDR